MPEFRTEIDIEPYEYVDECSQYEIDDLVEYLISEKHLESHTEELIDYLISEGHLESHEPVIKEKENSTLEDLEWNTAIDKLYKNRRHLTIEEEEYIKNLSKRF